MKITNINNKFFIEFDKNILDEEEIVKLIKYLKSKEIIYKSDLNKQDIEKLDNELKQGWWDRNKKFILSKIYDSNR
jgi:galactokinase/mevalonate kinase-like predicted kinase